MTDNDSFWSKRYQQRLDLWESTYGRYTDWLLMHDGESLARLTDPQWEDMFWYSYRMDLITEDEEWCQRLLDPEWWNSGFTELTFYSLRFDATCDGAFPGGLRDDGRLVLRALRIEGRSPMPWDHLVLWWRRRQSAVDE